MNSETTVYQAPHTRPFTAIGRRLRRFHIITSNWEYWPLYIFNIPVVINWLWQSVKSRDLFFFTLTNPGIPTGGFFGESKSSILQHIPDEFKPVTVLWEAPVNEEEIEDLFMKSGLSFPIIVKPEIGERGWLISRINSMQQLKNHIKTHAIDLILQSFIDWPLELSIMVYKLPDGSKAQVTSICQKEFLHVKGNGTSTVEQLILSQDRAFLQYESLKLKLGDRLYDVLAPAEYVLLEPIGNHCLGTKFLNRSDEIDDSINSVMVRLLSTMPDVHYGRFDMKVKSWDELRNGTGIAVLEFNGASSDPAHIYDPGYSIVQAYRDIFQHWSIMAKIAAQNLKTGKKPIGFKKIISALVIYFRYKRAN